MSKTSRAQSPAQTNKERGFRSMRHRAPGTLAILLIAWFGNQPVTIGQQGGPALVDVVELIEREVASGQSFVGTVTPPRRAVMGSAVDGRVVEVMVEEGDRVEKDQPLAKLLTQTIELELEAAKAELDLRTQQLNELENGSLPSEIEQSRARMERARVTAEFLQKDLQRLTTLGQRNATSESEVDAARSKAFVAEEDYSDAKAAYQLAVDGPRPERIAQFRAQVDMQDAIVRRLGDQISKYTIYARFAGYVTIKDTDAGEWVKQGDAIAEVIALDEVDVIAKVVDSQVPFIHVGDSVRVEVPALPGHALSGTVAAIVPQADVRSRTFPVKVRVKNEILASSEPLLKAGMLARVMLATGARTQAMLVPKDALVLGGAQPMIWLIDPATVTTSGSDMFLGKAVAAPVELGVADGGSIEVRGGLPPGVLVVVKGNERIIRSRTGEPSDVTWVKRAAITNDPSNAGTSEKAGNHVAH